MVSPFPPRQRGNRYPRHSGFAELSAAGTLAVVAAMPVFRGESLKGCQVDWTFWTDPPVNNDRPYTLIRYGAYFPYTFGLSGTLLDSAAIEEMVSEHVWDPLTNVGGDPGGGVGQSDQDDWVGEDEVGTAEIIVRDWFPLLPEAVGYTSVDAYRSIFKRSMKDSVRKNRYFGMDGFIAWWFGWTPNPQQDNALGIEVMDASINPSILLSMAEGGEDTGDHPRNQVRELVYGGDAFGVQSDQASPVHGNILIDATIGTPYPLPGNAW